MSRILGAAALALAFTFAAGASAQAADLHCTSFALTSQGELNGDDVQPITMSGTGTCSAGAIQDQSPASFTLSGTLLQDRCFANPYLTVNGTLTTTLSGGQVISTGAQLTVGPDPTGLGHTFAQLTTDDGHHGALRVDFDQPYVSGIIARCGGDGLAFSVSGLLRAQV